jgi:hypothetical protein
MDRVKFVAWCYFGNMVPMQWKKTLEGNPYRRMIATIGSDASVSKSDGAGCPARESSGNVGAASSFRPRPCGIVERPRLRGEILSRVKSDSFSTKRSSLDVPFGARDSDVTCRSAVVYASVQTTSDRGLG